MAAPGPRRQAREAALQVLFAADVRQTLTPEQVADSYDDVQEQFSLPTRARERGRELAVGVATHLKEIDERIGAVSSRWKVYRLATVDRNVLRVATFELLYEPDTPSEVIIDEALEVARRFAGEQSRSFVNGILDVIARGRAEAAEGALDAEERS
jgi:transcription antitermination protein NusB